MLVWYFLKGVVPYEGMTEAAIVSNTTARGMRPSLPSDPAFSEFFSRCWEAADDRRPTFGDIVKWLQSGRLVLPGAEVARKKPREEPLSDLEIEEQCDAVAAGDEAAAQRIMREMARDRTFSPRSLLNLVKASERLPEIRGQLVIPVQKLPDRLAFSTELFSAVGYEYAADFFLSCGVNSDTLSTFLLTVAAKQGDRAANDAVDRLLKQRPDSTFLFQAVSLSRIYYTRAFELMQSFPDEMTRLRLLPIFLDDAQDVDRVAMRDMVDKADNFEFDPKGVVLSRFVKWGYHTSVLRFASSPAHFKKLMGPLFGLLKGSCQGFLLKLVARASNVPALHGPLKGINIGKMFAAVIKAGDAEIAGRLVAAMVNYPKEQLIRCVSSCDQLQSLLETAPDVAQKSAICLTLVPFALHAFYVPSQYVIDTVSILLQSDEPPEVARGLVLGVAIAQKRDVAKKLADPYNLDAVCRFLRSEGAPPSYLYTATRFIIAVAPFLKLDRDTFPMISDAIGDLVELGIKAQAEKRLVVPVLQALALFPRLKNWDGLIAKFDVGTLLTALGKLYSGQSSIMFLIVQLQQRIGQ
jgi:hypothetical protein